MKRTTKAADVAASVLLAGAGVQGTANAQVVSPQSIADLLPSLSDSLGDPSEGSAVLNPLSGSSDVPGSSDLSPLGGSADIPGSSDLLGGSADIPGSSGLLSGSSDVPGSTNLLGG